MSLLTVALRVHDRLYQASDGRFGHRMLGVLALLLRTTGRRSAKIRPASLVYAADGADYLLVASNGGSDQPPAWLLNLEAEPKVEIQVERTRRPATARAVEASNPGFARLWTIVNEANGDRYVAYQRETSRPIPVIVITPTGA